MKPFTFTVVDKDGKEKKCVALVRKLTPSECYTLMGCDEKTTKILTTEAPVSRSAQYKQAGNSIVVDVLYHMFYQMFIDNTNKSQQMTIFDLL